jgi:hypothetical protein
MTRTVYATFDGEVLRPEGPLAVPPNTRVKITIDEPPEPDDEPPVSFIEIALGMDLQGPADWSERIDDYLYGDAGEARE